MTERNLLVNTGMDNVVTSRRTHRFADCPNLDGEPQTNLSEREVQLLGLAECKVCVKRSEGGPALQAIVSVLTNRQVFLGAGSGSDSDDSLLEAEPAARLILDGLKKRGFYISQRSPKEQS